MVDLCCTNCGGPLLMTAEEPHVQFTVTTTLGADGDVIDEKQNSGWCGKCTAEMDRAITND